MALGVFYYYGGIGSPSYCSYGAAPQDKSLAFVGRDTNQSDLLLILKSSTCCGPSSRPWIITTHYLSILSSELALLRWCSIYLHWGYCYLSNSPLLGYNLSSFLSNCYLFLYSSSIQDLSISLELRSGNGVMNLEGKSILNLPISIRFLSYQQWGKPTHPEEFCYIVISRLVHIFQVDKLLL